MRRAQLGREGEPVARRLSPEARRAEIIAATQEAIANDGYRALSLREVARRCGMSAPGLMHYFPDMPTLLEAVLDHRDEADLAAILESHGPEVTVLEMLELSREFYASRPAESRNFDTLEAEALDPSHPAHDYFVRRNQKALERMRPHVEHEFVDGEAVFRLLGLLIDGGRLRRLRSPDAGWADSDTDTDWLAIRDLLSRFPRRGAS